MKNYDVIVVGLGVMGAAAAYQCSKRGLRVLGLDSNKQGHRMGSSHGSTRAIRQTYFENPGYVPLVQRSYEMWRELERESGEGLMSLTGALYLAAENHAMLNGVKSAATTYNLPLQTFSPAELTQRFPGFVIPQGWQALYESDGGIIQAERSQHLQVELARQLSADIRYQTEALSWQQHNGFVRVETESGQYDAGQLILTIGPWACNKLGYLNLPLQGRKITAVTFNPKVCNQYNPRDFSVYFWATPEGVFAGFPNIDGEGIKIMRHDAQNTCTPENVDREIQQLDIDEVRQFADKYMPNVDGGINNVFTCMYTMTPDNHFVIDQVSADSNIYYATGFSGHGFKFAPVVGEILADFAQFGETEHPIGFLRSDRFIQL